MSKAFLYGLLQKSNIVCLEGEQCGICMEEYNIPSRETGMSEVAMRLPCNHIIGSACIATWLKDTNTCPICRREFFQTQPRPDLEHEIDDGQEDETLDDHNTSAIIEDFCDNLEFDSHATLISRYLVQNVLDSRLLDGDHSLWCVIAVGIYMGSHITGNPRSPREIAECAGPGLDAGHLREAYDIVYPERGELIDALTSSLLRRLFDNNVPDPLNWPAPGNEVTDLEIENRRDSQMLLEHCEQGCNELVLGPAIKGLTARIATRYFTAGLVGALSPREVTAASIFMASHMMWHSISPLRVARVLRIDPTHVRHAYGVAFLHQDILRRQPQLEGSGLHSIESLLRRIPSPS